MNKILCRAMTTSQLTFLQRISSLCSRCKTTNSTLVSVGCADNTLLTAFASARLMQLGFSFRLENVPIVNRDRFLLNAGQHSVDHDLLRVSN